MCTMIRVEKSRRMSGAGTVACMAEERNVQVFGGGNMKERGHFNRGVSGRVILKWIL